MNQYLISSCEVYRLESEAAVKQAIEEAKQSKDYQLIKYVSEYKERKQKGEVIDSYYKLTLTKNFNDIKEPDAYIDIKYNRELGHFPDAEVQEEESDNEF